MKLPGPTKDQPNVYEYGEVTYADIHADLSSKDKELYGPRLLVVSWLEMVFFGFLGEGGG